MIRFDPQVRIAYMSCPLVDLLAAASMWCAQTGIDLVFFRIEDPTDRAGRLHGFTLAADFATEGAAAEDLARLYVWLRRVLQSPWSVSLAADRVAAVWDVGGIPRRAGRTARLDRSGPSGPRG